MLPFFKRRFVSLKKTPKHTKSNYPIKIAYASIWAPFTGSHVGPGCHAASTIFDAWCGSIWSISCFSHPTHVPILLLLILGIYIQNNGVFLWWMRDFFWCLTPGEISTIFTRTVNVFVFWMEIFGGFHISHLHYFQGCHTDEVAFVSSNFM